MWFGKWLLFRRRASAWFHLGQFPKAVADLEHALTLQPGDLSSVTWIAPEAIARQSDEVFGNRCSLWRGRELIGISDRPIRWLPGQRFC